MDNRLICGTCGELGEVKRDDQDNSFYVTAICYGRHFLCATPPMLTEKEAIDFWVRMHEDD